MLSAPERRLGVSTNEGKIKQSRGVRVTNPTCTFASHKENPESGPTSAPDVSCVRAPPALFVSRVLPGSVRQSGVRETRPWMPVLFPSTCVTTAGLPASRSPVTFRV